MRHRVTLHGYEPRYSGDRLWDMARVGNIIFGLGLVVALVCSSHALSILLTWPTTPPLDPHLSPLANWFTPERIESLVLAFVGLVMVFLGWAARVRLRELEPAEKQETDVPEEGARASSMGRGSRSNSGSSAFTRLFSAGHFP